MSDRFFYLIRSNGTGDAVHVEDDSDSIRFYNNFFAAVWYANGFQQKAAPGEEWHVYNDKGVKVASAIRAEEVA